MTNQPILVVRRSHRRHGQLPVRRHHRHRPAHLALGFPTRLRVRSGRSRGSRLFLFRHGWRKARVSPDRLPGLEVQDGEQPPILGVADVRPRRDVFRVTGLGHVVRNDRALDPDGTLGHDDVDMRVVRRQHEIRGGLAVLKLDGRQLQLLLFLLGPLFLRGLLAKKLDQLLLFVLDELLAVGERGSGRFTATSVSCATTALPAATSAATGTMKRLPSRT